MATSKTWWLTTVCASILFGCSTRYSSSTSGSTAQDACTVNSITTGPCSISQSGLALTDLFGTNLTSWTNASASTSVSTVIPEGYYAGKQVTFAEPNLLAGNIAEGISIFGVTGTLSASGPSNAHRDKNTSQLTAKQETTDYSGAILPATASFSYRDVPSVIKDTNGVGNSNVTLVNRSSPIDWTGQTCGASGTLNARIADCATKLGAEATWDGTTKGNMGEGAWKLVSRKGDCSGSGASSLCQEVWRDERTKLLWSSRVSSASNWCKASGNNNISGNPAAENDPQNYCNNGTYQNTAGKAISVCFEDGETAFTAIDASIDNINGKAALGWSSTPRVAWRLPTINDYKQADINGIRYVLPDMGLNGDWEWSATSTSWPGDAWIFKTYGGEASSDSRTSNVKVRCLGR